MKTKDELNNLKEEYESLNRKLAELTEDELEQVTGGLSDDDARTVAKKAKELWNKGLLNFKQYSEVLEKAFRLEKEEYNQWAKLFACQNNLSPKILQI